MTFLKNFFMCMKLETGAYIIAYLEILKLIIIFVLGSIELSQKEPGEKISAHYQFYLVVLLLCVVHFISSVLLIIGASRQKSNYILPWIIITAIGLVGLVGLMVILAAGTTIFDNVQKNPAEYSCMIVKYIISFVLAIYFWLCMLSLYMRIRETESRDDSTSILNNKKYHRIEGGMPHKKWQAV